VSKDPKRTAEKPATPRKSPPAPVAVGPSANHALGFAAEIYELHMRANGAQACTTASSPQHGELQAIADHLLAAYEGAWGMLKTVIQGLNSDEHEIYEALSDRSDVFPVNGQHQPAPAYDHAGAMVCDGDPKDAPPIRPGDIVITDGPMVEVVTVREGDCVITKPLWCDTPATPEQLKSEKRFVWAVAECTLIRANGGAQ
jgi:hypothetical protein